MTATAGDAMPHVRLPRCSRGIFRPIWRRKFIGRPNQTGACVSKPGICSGYECMDCMKHTAGTPPFPRHSLTSITCPNFSLAEDDFDLKYL
jgi:hypothetical protein